MAGQPNKERSKKSRVSEFSLLMRGTPEHPLTNKVHLDIDLAQVALDGDKIHYEIGLFQKDKADRWSRDWAAEAKDFYERPFTALREENGKPWAPFREHLARDWRNFNAEWAAIRHEAYVWKHMYPESPSYGLLVHIRDEEPRIRFWMYAPNLKVDVKKDVMHGRVFFQNNTSTAEFMDWTRGL